MLARSCKVQTAFSCGFTEALTGFDNCVDDLGPDRKMAMITKLQFDGVEILERRGKSPYYITLQISY